MRKMFTRLFSLALLLLLFSAVTVKAQDECGSIISASDVVLVTDLATVCDSDYVRYEVVGYAGAEFAFNLDNDPGGFGGFTNDSAIVVKEGVGFRVIIRENDTCYSNELPYGAEDEIIPVELLEPSIEHPACYGDNGGEITINYSGQHDPLTFYLVPLADWSGPMDYPGNIVPGSKIAVEPGTYYVAVQEPNDCSVSLDSVTSWDTAIVNGPPSELVVDTIYGSDPLCIGEDGTVTVVVSGSIGGEYEVTVGGETMSTTNDTAVFDLPAGVDYFATVVDSSGCDAASDSMVTLVDPEAITFDIAITDITCADGATGVIKVFDFTPSGGAFEASLGDGNWVAQTIGDTIFITGLEVGYYALFVDNTEDACDSVPYDNGNETGNVISLQAPGEIDYTVSYNDTIICYGDSTMVTIEGVTGGSGSYEYYINAVGVWGSTSSWELPAGNYDVSVRDADDNTCAIPRDNIDIIQVSPVYINYVETVSPTCPGGNDGLIKIFAVDGNGTYEYSIDNGDTWYTNNVFAVAGGDYDVLVRDPLCPDYSAYSDVYVELLYGHDISLNWADTMVCEGALSGGFEGELYWDAPQLYQRDVQVYLSSELEDVYVSGEEVYTDRNGKSTFYFGWDDDLAPGTYYIWAKDNFGCVVDADIDGTPDYITLTIHENPTPTVTGTVTEEAACFEDNDGVLTLHLNGEPLDDLYYILANSYEAALNKDALNNGIMWPEGADSVNIQVGKGTYYAVLMDNYCDDGERSISGPFTVEGYDDVMIDEDPVSVTDIVCYGDANGAIEIAAATGGSGDLVYTLMMDDGEEWVEVPGYVEVTETTFTGLEAGYYYVEVTDLAGCDGATTDEITVDGPDAPVYLYDWYTDDISCNGASDGKVGFWVEGGTGPYEYKIGTTNWQSFPAESWGPKPGHTQEILITKPGDYTVLMRDALGCMANPFEFTINEPVAIVLTTDESNNTNSCDDPNGEIDITITGGQVGMTYTVTVNDSIYPTPVDSGVTITYAELDAGIYNVSVVETSGNACEVTETVEITSPSGLYAEASISNEVLCNGDVDGAIIVDSISGGTTDYTVSISPVAGVVDGYEITDLPADSYVVTVTDAAGCTFDIPVDLTEPTELALEATWMKNITCEEPFGQFSVQATGGVGDYVYYTAMSDPETGHVLIEDLPTSDREDWETDSILTVPEAGTWIVWAMDANGCIIGGEEDEDGPVNEWRVQILEPSIVVSFDKDVEDAPLCNGEMTAMVVVSNVVIEEDEIVITEDYTVMIDGIENDTVTDLGAGTYYITVTHDASGCSTLDSVVIEEPEVLEVTLAPVDGEFTCPDVTEGFIQATVTGGMIPLGPVQKTKSASSAKDWTPFYEFQLWQDGVLLTDYNNYDAFLVDIDHDYFVVVRDLNGCTDTSNVITIDPVAAPELIGLKDVTCSSDTLASVKVTATADGDRQVYVKWTQFEDESGVYSDSTALMAQGEIFIDQQFIFDNEEVEDIHYEFQVIDEMGCVSLKDTMTFDQIINAPLELTVVKGEAGDCTTEVTVTAAGGVAPYTIMVDGEETTESVLMLGGGTYVISVKDAHECEVAEEITLEYGISADTTVETYTGEAVQFVVEEAMLDTMLYVGEYSFYHNVDTACVAELNVTVIEKDRAMPVLDTVTPQDTTENNHPVFTIVFEDNVTFNDSVMGYLTVTPKDSAEAALTIEITEAMVVGNTITVTYEWAAGEPGLENNTTYTVAVDSGIVNGDGLAWDGEVGDWMFTTGADWATGIIPEFTQEDFKVYPNPFNDYIKVDNYDKLSRVVITNIAGQRVLDIEYPSYEIRTGNLVTGVYVVTLIRDNSIVKSERIIKR